MCSSLDFRVGKAAMSFVGCKMDFRSVGGELVKEILILLPGGLRLLVIFCCCVFIVQALDG